MLKFLFELDKNIPQKDEPRYDAYSKGFIEGDVTIHASNSVFFQKSCV
ncbi:cytoplasmic protein, partial [Bacillus cereus]